MRERPFISPDCPNVSEKESVGFVAAGGGGLAGYLTQIDDRETRERERKREREERERGEREMQESSSYPQE